MEEVASRNRKNTATASRDTILTALWGCRARTLAASSCTVMETEMRRAMSTSSLTKASIPLGFRGDCLRDMGERPNHPLFENSVYATCSVRGTAPSTMDMESTMAISSSSPSCASLAASSSSRAMPKETEKARSAPSAPNASVVDDICDLGALGDYEEDVVAGDAYGEEILQETREVYPCEVNSCAEEGCSVSRRLAWQDESVRLHVRRLLLSDRETKGVCKGALGTKKRKRRLAGGGTVSTTVGTIFGSTLGNLFHYGRGFKHTLAVARLRLELVMDPAAAAAGSMRGEDRVHLMRGMGHHRVVGALGTKLTEVRLSLPMSDKSKSKSREAHVGMVYGATVALLVSLSLLAVAQLDEADLESLVEPACEELHNHLGAWRTGGVSWIAEDRAALAAELRAAERALQAVRIARQRAETARMGPGESTRLQLTFYRRAAWPVGQKVGGGEQEELLKRLRSGELVDVEPEGVQLHPSAPHAVKTPGVLPLSALVFGPRGALGNASDSEEGKSSCASSSLGSWASWAS